MFCTIKSLILPSWHPDQRAMKCPESGVRPSYKCELGTGIETIERGRGPAQAHRQSEKLSQSRPGANVQFMMSICSGLYLIVIVLRCFTQRGDQIQAAQLIFWENHGEISMTGGECLMLSQCPLIINSGWMSWWLLTYDNHRLCMSRAHQCFCYECPGLRMRTAHLTEAR